MLPSLVNARSFGRRARPDSSADSYLRHTAKPPLARPQRMT